MTLLMVIIGAAVGAPLRYLGDRMVHRRLRGTSLGVLPVGTLVVNVAACLILGIVTGAALAGAAPHRVQALVGIGFCGTLSTYSTFAYETVRLGESGLRLQALLTAAASVGCGLAAAFAGAGIADALW